MNGVYCDSSQAVGVSGATLGRSNIPFLDNGAVVAFEVGRTYTARSSSDSRCIFSYLVTKRTTCMVWLFEGGDTKVQRRAIYIHDSVECCRPEGQYSQCPVIRADRWQGREEVKATPPPATLEEANAIPPALPAASAFRKAWTAACDVATQYGCSAEMDSGRVLLNGHVVFDRLRDSAVNQTAIDVMHALLNRNVTCADCPEPATGIDIELDVDVCEAHRPASGGAA